jgi:hypothetical protein
MLQRVSRLARYLRGLWVLGAVVLVCVGRFRAASVVAGWRRLRCRGVCRAGRVSMPFRLHWTAIRQPER